MTQRVVVFNNMVTPYTNRLYNQLKAEGVDINVISCSAQEANRNWADTIAPQYPHKVLAGHSFRIGTGRYVHFNSAIISTLRKLRPDDLIINGFYPSMLIAAAWALLSGTRLSLTIDGWRRTMPQSILHRLVRPFVVRRCKSVVVCGEKGRAYFVEEGSSANDVFTVPLVPAWDAPDEIAPFSERKYHLLWCAHLNNDMKNASFLVDVARELKARIPDLAIRVVGKGEDEAAVISALRALDVDVMHERQVDWRDMADVFTSARMLLLPSLWEPWGLVCNEAMQCGTPCAVSPFVGAGGDLVLDGGNGHVLPLDAKLWAETLEAELIDENQWNALSIASRAAMSQRSVTRSAAAFRAMLKKTQAI